MAKKQIDAEIKISGADESRQQLDKVRDAAVDFGEEGVRSASNLVRAFENIERAEDRLNRKFIEGGDISEREVKQMVQTFAALESQINETFGSIGKAPAAIQEAMRKSEQSIDRATAKVRESKDAWDDHRGKLSEAGESYNGLTDAIGRAIPQLGGFTAKLGLIGAAFTSGLAAGQRFNEWIGTDMTLWNEMMDRLASKVGALVRSAAEGVTAIGNVVSAFLSGNLGEFKRALGELKDHTVSHMKLLGDAVTKYGADWDGLHPKIAKATEETKKHVEAVKASNDALEKAKKAHADAKEALDENISAQEKLKKAIDDTAEALKKEELSLRSAQMAEIDAEHVVINRTSDMQAFGREVNRVAEELRKQTVEVEALRAKYGESDPMVRGAVERQQELERALLVSEGRLQQAQEDVKLYEAAQRRAHEAVERHKEKLGELGETQKRQETALQTLAGQTNALAGAASAAAFAQERLAEATQKLASPAANVAAATERIGNQGSKPAETMQKLGEATSSATDSMSKAAHNASELATGLERAAAVMNATNLSTTLQSYRELASVIGQINTGLAKMIELAPIAKEKMDELGAGGMGGDDGETLVA